MKFLENYLPVFVVICVTVGMRWVTCEASGQPNCSGTTCDAGQVCVLQQVMCFRAPCYPIPECVPKDEGSYLPQKLIGKCGKQVPECNKSCPSEERCEILDISGIYSAQCIAVGKDSGE